MSRDDQAAALGAIGRDETAPAQGRERTTDLLALAAMAALCLLLVLDIVKLPSQLPKARPTGNDSIPILAAGGYNQVVSSIIGVALNRAPRGARELVATKDLSLLSARPGDEMVNGVAPALTLSQLEQNSPWPVVGRVYDPVVSAETFESWVGAGRVTSYPKDVYLVTPADGGTKAWVLCTDPTRMSIYVVPAADAPPGAVL